MVKLFVLTLCLSVFSWIQSICKFIILKETSVLINLLNPNYLEWYSPYLDLEHAIQVCRGEMVKIVILFTLYEHVFHSRFFELRIYCLW